VPHRRALLCPRALVRLPGQASSSVAVPFSSAPVVQAAIRRVLVPPQADRASLQAVVPCIPPVPRRQVPRVAVPALVSDPAVRVAGLALVPDLAVPVGLAVD
jgi:hypothetical protein